MAGNHPGFLEENGQRTCFFPFSAEEQNLKLDEGARKEGFNWF